MSKLKHLSMQLMNMFQQLSEAWHWFLSLSSNKCREQQKRRADEELTYEQVQQLSHSEVADHQQQKRADEELACKQVQQLSHDEVADLKCGHEKKKVLHDRLLKSQQQQSKHQKISSEKILTATKLMLGQNEVSFQSEEQN